MRVWQDDRLARVALSRIVEPGDPRLPASISSIGPVETLQQLARIRSGNRQAAYTFEKRLVLNRRLCVFSQYAFLFNRVFQKRGQDGVITGLDRDTYLHVRIRRGSITMHFLGTRRGNGKPLYPLIIYT